MTLLLIFCVCLFVEQSMNFYLKNFTLAENWKIESLTLYLCISSSLSLYLFLSLCLSVSISMSNWFAITVDDRFVYVICDECACDVQLWWQNFQGDNHPSGNNNSNNKNNEQTAFVTVSHFQIDSPNFGIIDACQLERKLFKTNVTVNLFYSHEFQMQLRS